MKIAFVGKGGAGKSTLCALFTDYLRKNIQNNIWVVDADMNIHISDLLNLETIPPKKHLSSKESQTKIKSYIKHNNNLIESIYHIKKTTPPTPVSGFINLGESDNMIFHQFSTYLEIILSHTIDLNEFVVVDMVAGVDAFAGTLHAQFDILILSIEPTERSIGVYKQYKDLAESAGIFHKLFVIGNKIEDEDDENFIQENIDINKLIGFISLDRHVRLVDKKRENLDYHKINNESIATLNSLFMLVNDCNISFNQRFKKLCELHKNYIAQDYIVERFGDLNQQIDKTFDFDKFVIEKYGKPIKK